MTDPLEPLRLPASRRQAPDLSTSIRSPSPDDQAMRLRDRATGKQPDRQAVRYRQPVYARIRGSMRLQVRHANAGDRRHRPVGRQLVPLPSSRRSALIWAIILAGRRGEFPPACGTW